MSTGRTHLIKREGTNQIAQAVKRNLVLLIALLIAAVLVLTFRIGESVWPAWLIEARILIRGILLFAVVFLIPLSPVIIEASSNTRTLSGPGKNPEFWN